MLCTEIVSDIQNNFYTQHVLPTYVLQKEELLTKIYLYIPSILFWLSLSNGGSFERGE